MSRRSSGVPEGERDGAVSGGEHAYGDHDMVEEVRPERYGPDEVRDVRWVVCRRCGCELALDERTQRLPRASCDHELAKGVMES